MGRFSNAEKQREAAREVVHRRKVYDRMVAEWKMHQVESDRRIAIMSEISDDYFALAEGDAPRLELNREKSK
jgi:hypothetical protein